MKILQLHNFYKISGGEDVVVRAEKNVLEAHGNSVALLDVDNDAIASKFSQAMTAVNAIYSHASKQRVLQEINRFRPDIVHVHNFFPLLSPAVYDACREARVPVVQTLHNFRLFCSNSFFYRDGKVCEDCMGKFFPTPAVVHACYRDSHVGSAVVGTMQTVHRIRGTWRDRVERYIALTDFARNKFIEGGLPANKITVKPNFVSVDPGCGEGRGDYALFVGRLSPEKGIETLITAWEKLGDRIGLKIIGDGPLSPTVEQAATRIPGVEWMGRQSQNQLQALLKNAQVLIFPSLWYETFGLVVIEAYAAGVPVIASNLGTMSLLIDPGRTGLLFRAGDAQDLQERVEWMLSHPQEVKKMRQEARREFESKYTATQNYQQLMEIYETVRS
ncbi:glycosyltransferase [Laspinema olomoucense]|uniref:Glycosyltransferase n=1 Tax=Laspinema olomoucense D3b TaxID=2953688 RepID=A0ABT2NAN0_9CYAN|nr:MULTISPECIES: glycosyltransferase [unclassified Laspinema]MCT7972274.1 glycosyltransferase [Laspinema sp. D3d]MCT7978410.1 glycosyltransferase [Laspinema sp. D3b]